MPTLDEADMNKPHKIIAVLPARKGWVGLFGNGARVPVIAWALVESRDPDTKGIQTFDGIGVWRDGPNLMGGFSDFQGFEPANGDWGQ